MSELQALPDRERLPLLDTVRGVALLGILIMNMPGFGASFFIEADGSHFWTHPVDQAAEQLRDALFSGKFNSMFSLLFGLGFTLQYQRMLERDPASATATYLRRLGVLLAFGLVHACVFWTGDILHLYAVLGLGLIALRGVSDRVLWGLIVFSLVYPALSGSLRVLVMTPEIVALKVQEAQAFEASNNLAYGSGSFLQAAAEHTREFVSYFDDRWDWWGQLSGAVQIGMTMLLGVLAGRNR